MPKRADQKRRVEVMGDARRTAKRSDVLFTCRCGTEHYPPMYRLLKSDFVCDACYSARYRAARARKNPDLKRVPRWTPEEDALLLTGQPVPRRTAEACRNRRQALADTETLPRWSDEDKKRLRKLAGKVPVAELDRHFVGRSTASIVQLASRLGISLKIERQRLYALSDRQRALTPAAVEKAVPKALPAQVRTEVVQELSAAVLARRVAFKDIAKQVKPFITKAYAMFPNFGAPISLDTPLFDDGSTTLGDRISSDTNLWERAA